VPFTSESKEAIADYDEIRKEIRLALQECGRRLGVFVRRREHAKSEFRRRNIFDLYIEEVVEACNRLKGGKLPKQKLKEQLQKIALKRTGGQKTDELLGRDGGGPEGLPDSIIVTPDGVEGDAPVLPGGHGDAAEPGELPLEVAKSTPGAAFAAKAKAAKATSTGSKSPAQKNPAKVPVAGSAAQMTLGFDKDAKSAKRSNKNGENHGAKKTKK
jgi:DNA topoisomerase VI subunit B